jgi:hypothetical protein
MTRWDAFADVCGYLRGGFLGGKPPRRRRNREWKLLIEMSSSFRDPVASWVPA